MIKSDKGIRDSYKLYRANNKNCIGREDYVHLCNEYNKFLINKVLDGNEVTLPLRMGTLSIIGKKEKVRLKDDGTPTLSPNWPKTKKLWERCEECKEKKQLIYNTNEHSNGVRYKIIWSTKNVLVRYVSLYSFILTRKIKDQSVKIYLKEKNTL